MKTFGPESGGSWCFPSFIVTVVAIILEAVVFSMAGKLITRQCMALCRTLIKIVYRF